MKLTGTLYAYLDTESDFRTTQFADAITDDDMGKALDALTLSNISFATLGGYLSLGVATVTVQSDALDKNEIIHRAVEALRAKRTEILAEAQAQATAIDAKIQNLLAIDYTPPADDGGITDVVLDGDAS